MTAVASAQDTVPISVSAPVPVREPGPGPMRRFMETIGRDLKSLPSKESLKLLSLGTAFALASAPFDETLTLQASSSTFLKTTFGSWARVVGQEWALGSSALATLVAGRVTGNARATRVGADLIEAQFISGVSTLALKVAVSRERPDREARSFPSGHAGGTFAMATVIDRHFGWKASASAYAVAGLISGARLQANSHYATDVIAGATLGILAGRAATFDLGESSVVISPAAVPGGAAVIFSVIK